MNSIVVNNICQTFDSDWDVHKRREYSQLTMLSLRACSLIPSQSSRTATDCSFRGYSLLIGQHPNQQASYWPMRCEQTQT